MMHTLTVATFNIHHGARQDGELDLPAIAQVIKSFQADVVALQEVDRHYSTRSDFVDQAAWLGAELGMHAEFSATITLEPSAGKTHPREYGLATLLREKPRSSGRARLPEPRVVERRGVLRTKIKVGNRRVNVFNTHLTTQPGRIRREQFRAVQDMADRSLLPTIVLGDFNSPSYSPWDYATLTRDFNDAWRSPGYLRERFLRGATNPVSPFPIRRIDYVLHSDDIRTLDVRKVLTDTSDHLPVVATLAIPDEALTQ